MRQVIRRIDRNPAGWSTVLMIGLLAAGVGVNVASSYFEAQAYNRLTGANVSTWDAMFLQLRVQESPE